MNDSGMSLPINLHLFIQNLNLYLGSKLPVSEIDNFITKYPKEVESYINEIDNSIQCFNAFRKDPHFPNHDYYRNAINLDKIYHQNLSEYAQIYKQIEEDMNLSHVVYSDLKMNEYFTEVWEIRPINYLIINIFLLIYRTVLLHSHEDVFFDCSGNRLVQISSVIEEMVYYQYLHDVEGNLFLALRIWLEKWKEEGFDQRLYTAILDHNNDNSRAIILS